MLNTAHVKKIASFICFKGKYRFLSTGLEIIIVKEKNKLTKSPFIKGGQREFIYINNI